MYSPPPPPQQGSTSSSILLNGIGVQASWSARSLDVSSEDRRHVVRLSLVRAEGKQGSSCGSVDSSAAGHCYRRHQVAGAFHNVLRSRFHRGMLYKIVATARVGAGLSSSLYSSELQDLPCRVLKI